MKLEERTFGTPCNQAEVWNFVKPFLLNVFAAVGSSDMRIRFKLKKYSDSLFLWYNERKGMTE